MNKFHTIAQYLRRALLVVGATWVLTGCNRNLPGSTSGSATQADKGRYEVAVKQAFDYKYLQSKVKLSMKGKTLNGTLRMEQGKFLSLTVNAPIIGIEVGRIEVSKDSLKVINKINKVYLAEPLSKVRERFSDEINIDALQCLFLGRMYIPERGEAIARDYKRLAWNNLQTPYLTGVYGQNANYTLTYMLDANSLLHATLLEMTTNDAKAQWTYDNYTDTQRGGVFPQKETIVVNMASKSLQAGITLNAPTFPKTGIAPLEISSSYRKVTASQMFDLLKNLK